MVSGCTLFIFRLEELPSFESGPGPRFRSQSGGRYAGEWIRDYVILEAKALLKSGQYTIQQVSDMLNFANQPFFGVYFKKAVGCSPTAYREM